MTKDDGNLSGEQRLKARRRRFYRYLAVAFVVSMIVGMLSGGLAAFYEDGAVPLWIPLVVCVAVALAFAWFTYDYFRRVDELDRMDNLWAHLIGFYGGLIVFGVWYFLAELDLAAKPSAVATVAIMAGLTFVAYGLRKLGLR
jgi:intracellular septation protein A